MNDKQNDTEAAQEERQLYEVPAVIYTGQLTTRAGSGLPGGEGAAESHKVDPADLFRD